MYRLKDVLIKKEDFVARKIDSEYLIVPIKNNIAEMDRVYNLNEVGAFIFEKIDGNNNVEDIIRAVIEQFDIEYEVAEKDVIEYLLEINNLLIRKK
jgi:methyltransferase-like protein